MYVCMYVCIYVCMYVCTSNEQTSPAKSVGLTVQIKAIAQIAYQNASGNVLIELRSLPAPAEDPELCDRHMDSRIRERLKSVL